MWYLARPLLYDQRGGPIDEEAHNGLTIEESTVYPRIHKSTLCELAREGKLIS